MKILPVSLIREADRYTIEHEPISDIDLMERASSLCFGWINKNFSQERRIKVFCGTGNNGGDGLAIARMLKEAGYDVRVYITGPAARMSSSCRINYSGLPAGIRPVFIEDGDFPSIDPADLVIDAIIGSGLTRAAKGVAARLIDHINRSGAEVIAIDVPSGLHCDSSMAGVDRPAVIRARYTISFAPAKLAFFFPENEQFTGHWILFDIGIPAAFMQQAGVNNYMIEAGDVAGMLKRRRKFSHKGSFGHALLICGSTGKTGAAILAANACLRSGSGLVTVHLPASGIQVLHSSVPEAMVSPDPDPDHFSVLPDLTRYSAAGVGPGIGTGAATAQALKLLIQEFRKPLLFDADALNILSENRTWLGFLTPDSIFTPHPGEFERLVGHAGNDFIRNRMQRDFSIRFQCYVVLKGAHTAITTPTGACYFNTTGNPGMSTGGSGDVLTGIIAGLLAQGYNQLEACLLGVYIHGLAGDFALQEQGFEALISGDIISHMGKAFKSLYGEF